MGVRTMDYPTDGDGIATLTWDAASRSRSVTDAAGAAAFCAALDRALGDAAVKGILIVAAQADFVADADLDTILRADDAGVLFERAMDWNRRLRAMETGGKPVAAALPASVLGAGMELALACHYRVAAENDRARFGLTQVTFGLIPGGGATQRLPRLIGIAQTLPLLLEGRRLTARAALDAGIVHALVPRGQEIPAARQWLLGQGSQRPQQPWDGKGYRIPGGAVQSPAGIQTFMAGNARLREKTCNNHPAARNIMACVYEGLQTDIDTGLKIEARYFAATALTPEAKNMIRLLHFGVRDANQLASRPSGVPVQAFTRVGILGAGMMGAGIAYAAAAAGIGVVLLDTTPVAADRGKSYSESLLAKQVEKGLATPEQRDAILGRIAPTTDFADLQGCELAIEAVFEDRAIKADVTRKSEAVLAASAILCLEHVHAADHGPGAGERAPRQFHRPSFLLAGRAHAAGGGHRRQADQPADAGALDGLRANHRQDADRGQRRPRLLHQPRLCRLPGRRTGDAGPGGEAGARRQCRAHGRDAAGSARSHR